MRLFPTEQKCSSCCNLPREEQGRRYLLDGVLVCSRCDYCETWRVFKDPR